MKNTAELISYTPCNGMPKRKRNSPVTYVKFTFGEYSVHTSYPYTRWFVKWQSTQIAQFDFEQDGYRPEQTVTISRARHCFEEATVV